MTTVFMRAVDQRSADAQATGALQPIVAEQTEIRDQGLPFSIRWLSSLAAKGAAKAAMPGGPRDPDFNPFLSPEPALTVGPVGDHHLAILNKFPVCDRHLVLARRHFEEQRLPLALEDFMALAAIMSQSGGLGFYNGGQEAGASQRHKHVQWIPSAPGNPGLHYLTRALPQTGRPSAAIAHPKLSARHAFLPVLFDADADAGELASSMHAAFGLACRELDLAPDAAGLLPPCNMLVQDGWLLVVPRSREHAYDVSVNALSYGGTLYVRHPEQVEPVRSAGPLAVLTLAGYAAARPGETAAGR
jgi:ATP adenylyltransferase